MKKLLEVFKKANGNIKLLVQIGALCLLLSVVGVILVSNKDAKLEIISESSLKEIIEIEELATLEYFYNSIAQVTEEDVEKVKYHVAYEGTIRYGINFEGITISIDEQNKIINIVVPEVNLIDSEVNIETLDFIFEKDKYEIETVVMEAKSICETDLENKASQNADLKKMAKENAIDTINALICPWIDQIAEEYKVVVR